MKKVLYYLIIISVIFLSNCSSGFLNPGFDHFTQATELIGKNVIYSFEKLQEEEMNLRVAEATKLESIKPSDLEPRVLTFEHLERRRELLEYLVKYTQLLATIFEDSKKDDILESASRVNENLRRISQNHDDFLTPREIGIFSALAAAIPQALTYAKKRSVVLKIMKDNQSLINKIASKLKQEMELTRTMINNFYDRQFMNRVALQWPDKETKREKIAKLGVKILSNKNRINIILNDVINALKIIPKIHAELRTSLKTHSSPVRALNDLLDTGYRIKEL
jgi:hypothetical protein